MDQVIEKNLPRIILEQRDEILEIAARYGAHNVRIFGSVARGEAGPESDVDFLVEMESGRSLFDLAGLLHDLKEFLNCEVDVVTEKGLRPRIKERVLEEAVPL
jgi:uncharacterized protein